MSAIRCPSARRNRRDVSRQLRAGAAGKADDLRTGYLGANAFHDPPRRLDRPALKLARQQHAGPGFEDLQHVGAGSELRQQMRDRVFRQHIDDFCECVGMAIRHHPRRRLIRRALPGHHVGRHRPRRAAKSDQGDVRIGFAPHPLQRFEHRFELGEVGGHRQRFDLVRRLRRIEPRGLRRPRTAPSGPARGGCHGKKGAS
jgi:hypothetical protein